MPTRLTLEPGDMIIFEDTEEICVLVERFDSVLRRRQDDLQAKKSVDEVLGFPKWCWNTTWIRPWQEAGEWQKRLSTPPKHQRYFGVSSMNLFNFLSHHRAYKKGKTIRVPKRSS